MNNKFFSTISEGGIKPLTGVEGQPLREIREIGVGEWFAEGKIESKKTKEQITNARSKPSTTTL